ncbi:peroxide stress protein YaaA [Pedomonas mirosovicensis]|uniref:peroxide stress protein YaaA n=1 Tax=Pedomonas mirosovicensis TaxID=2908641 RepID=UPI002169143A|nr:peroxide stress protein YaaA [Pedomonas mirosovicensis]MCH8685046.1 peroxide stress protein YaaA [Pedomonas mirosovicensis]
MLTLLSPAKSLDFETPLPLVEPTQPQLLARATELVGHARKLSAEDLKALMGISDALAELNVARFANFTTPFTPENARPAIYAFNGDVYTGFDVKTLDAETVDFTQGHVRILSGLYGVLRPLDLMQAYRLEMGIAFRTPQAKTLYGYWGETITQLLNDHLSGHDNRAVVNLASQEYFGAVQPKKLAAPVITPLFKERRGNQLKVISFSAKKARGQMARYICANRIDRPEALKDFAEDNYRFDPHLSDESTWLFVR